jgi:hypothetical protein
MVETLEASKWYWESFARKEECQSKDWFRSQGTLNNVRIQNKPLHLVLNK